MRLLLRQFGVYYNWNTNKGNTKMQSFCTELLNHPILLVIMLMFFMGFVGMTYEFILRLCGKSPFLPNQQNVEHEGNNEPPEPANVPKPPQPPKDTLNAANEIPDGVEEVDNEDGTFTVEFTYPTEESNEVKYTLNPEHESMKERTH